MIDKTQVVKTPYESEQAKFFLAVFLLQIFPFALFIVAVIIAEGLAETLSLILIFSALTVWIVCIIIIFAVILPKRKNALRESYNFYRDYEGDKICTYLNFPRAYEGRSAKIKGPFIIGKQGVANEQISIPWDKHLLELSHQDFYGQSMVFFNLVSGEGDIYTFSADYKNYLLFKKYCPSLPPEFDELDEYIERMHRIKTKSQRDSSVVNQTYFEGEEFKNRYGLVLTLVFAGVFGLIVLAMVILVRAGFDTEFLPATGVIIFLPTSLTFNFFPRGNVYITEEKVTRKTFLGVESLNLDNAQIIYTPFKIIFKSTVKSISIYRTKRSFAFVKELEEKLKDKQNPFKEENL